MPTLATDTSIVLTPPFDLNTEEVVNSPEIDAMSADFVVGWKTLVSQTNWEKGRLIGEWRAQLVAAEMPRGAYSDEAWARRVGGVSAQHVGRLRRVAERFGSVAAQYPRLFWSHFQASLDWNDAEMWLEGAVQSGWSVMQMQMQRWEAQGAPAHLKPSDDDVFTGELDDEPRSRREPHEPSSQESVGKSKTTRVRSTEDEDADADTAEPKSDGRSTASVLSELRSMEPLPNDLQQAFEGLQVAILNHKATKFRDVDPHRILGVLDTFKQMVLSKEVQ